MIELYENLYQGSSFDYDEHGYKFDAVLCCIAGEFDITLGWDAPRFYTYLKSPDGTGFDEHILKMGMDFLLNTHGHGYKTLIHCYAGMSRSVCIAACYLSVIKEQSLDASLKEIHALKRVEEKKVYQLIMPSAAVFTITKGYLSKFREKTLNEYKQLWIERSVPKIKQTYRIPKFGDINIDELNFNNDKLLKELFGKENKDEKTME